MATMRTTAPRGRWPSGRSRPASIAGPARLAARYGSKKGPTWSGSSWPTTHTCTAASPGRRTLRSQRDWSLHQSIVDGNHATTVVTANHLGHNLAAIDGFVVRNGNGSDGGGIYCESAVTIANNTITGNSADTGGGIYCTAASLIANNVIMGNGVVSFWYACGGGGIYCASDAAVIVNNTITSNVALLGGGIYCDGSPTIVNTLVAFNSSGIDAAEGYSPSPAIQLRLRQPGWQLRQTDRSDRGRTATSPSIQDWPTSPTETSTSSPAPRASMPGIRPASRPTGGTWTASRGSTPRPWTSGPTSATAPSGYADPIAIVRVKPDGDDAHDGSTWALAKRTVQAGIDAADATGPRRLGPGRDLPRTHQPPPVRAPVRRLRRHRDRSIATRVVRPAKHPGRQPGRLCRDRGQLGLPAVDA